MHRYRGHVRLFDSEISDEEIKFYCGMDSKHSKKIVRKLREDRCVTTGAFADDLGVSPKAIHRTLESMHEVGLLDRRGVRPAFYSMTTGAWKFIEKHGRK